MVEEKKAKNALEPSKQRKIQLCRFPWLEQNIHKTKPGRRRGRKDDNANYFCKQICTIVFTVEFPWDYYALRLQALLYIFENT